MLYEKNGLCSNHFKIKPVSFNSDLLNLFFEKFFLSTRKNQDNDS